MRLAASALASHFAFAATLSHSCQHWRCSTAGDDLPCLYAETKLATNFGREQWIGERRGSMVRHIAVRCTRRYDGAPIFARGSHAPCSVRKSLLHRCASYMNPFLSPPSESPKSRIEHSALCPLWIISCFIYPLRSSLLVRQLHPWLHLRLKNIPPCQPASAQSAERDVD